MGDYRIPDITAPASGMTMGMLEIEVGTAKSWNVSDNYFHYGDGSATESYGIKIGRKSVEVRGLFITPRATASAEGVFTLLNAGRKGWRRPIRWLAMQLLRLAGWRA